MTKEQLRDLARYLLNEEKKDHKAIFERLSEEDKKKLSPIIREQAKIMNDALRMENEAARLEHLAIKMETERTKREITEIKRLTNSPRRLLYNIPSISRFSIFHCLPPETLVYNNGEA